MALKKRKQCVGALNYQKRKDIAGEVRADMGSAEARVKGGELVVEGVVGSGEVQVEGEIVVHSLTGVYSQ